eukprot:Em0005g288a
MHFAFATCVEYECEAQNLQERLKHSRTIHGTHQIHCAKPLSADIMENPRTGFAYNVSINDSVNTLVPIPSTGAPQYTFTGLTNNTVYTVSVVAINCAGSSSPATMTVSTPLQYHY